MYPSPRPMSSEVPTTPPGRRTKALLAAAAAAGAAATFASCVLWVRDPDLFHHLAYGRHLWRSGLAPGEPFLFPLLGAPAGVPPYWLGSLAIYGWERIAGVGGLQLLPALVSAALAVVLLVDSSPRGGRHTALSLAAAAPPLVLALLAFRYRAVPRPEIFGVLLAAILLLGLRRVEEGDRRLLLASPLLVFLWTNLHPSVVAGLALLGTALAIAVAQAVLTRPRAGAGAARSPAREAVLLAGVLAASAAAALATPSPQSPVSAALRFAAAHYLPHGSGAAAASDVAYDRSVLARIPEMQPATAHFWVEPFGILLALTAVALVAALALPARRAERAREMVTVALLGWLTLGAARFAVLLAVACAPIAARALGDLAASLPERLGRFPARLAGGGTCVLAALAALPLATAEPTFCVGSGLRPGAYPVRGVDYLEALGFRGRLYNTFQFGGYLAWRGVGPPYQDGRGVWVKGEEQAAMAGPFNRISFLALDSKYRFDALLLAYPDDRPETNAKLEAAFGRSDWAADRRDWSLVAFDDGGLLYLRRDGAYAARAAADEYRVALPANANLAPTPMQIPLLLSEFRRSVREAPECSLCRYYLAVSALEMGLPDEARAALGGIPVPSCPAHPLQLDALRAAIAEARR